MAVTSVQPATCAAKPAALERQQRERENRDAIAERERRRDRQRLRAGRIVANPESVAGLSPATSAYSEAAQADARRARRRARGRT